MIYVCGPTTTTTTTAAATTTTATTTTTTATTAAATITTTTTTTTATTITTTTADNIATSLHEKLTLRGRLEHCYVAISNIAKGSISFVKSVRPLERTVFQMDGFS